MKPPKLLDLYCGAGLAAIGYKQAGFEVWGVDIEQKTCYGGDRFIKADALEVLKDKAFLAQFSAVHASPPCQRYSTSTAMFRARGKTYPDLVAVAREGLKKNGMPYVIENVRNAPIRRDLTLRGDMFGLKVIRVRCFELGFWWMFQPYLPALVGGTRTGDFVTIIGRAGYRKYKALPKDWRPNFDQGTILKTWHYAMGIPPGHTFKDTEISEGIPPAYSRYIGEHLLEFIA